MNEPIVLSPLTQAQTAIILLNGAMGGVATGADPFICNAIRTFAQQFNNKELHEVVALLKEWIQRQMHEKHTEYFSTFNTYMNIEHGDGYTHFNDEQLKKYRLLWIKEMIGTVEEYGYVPVDSKFPLRAVDYAWRQDHA